ncbi:MAG TPA: Dna2/Cas4 domain-containing protein [Anaerolineaceae bacterium]
MPVVIGVGSAGSEPDTCLAAVGMDMGLTLLAVVLCAAALFFLWLGRRKRKMTGLPVGKLVYTDTGAWNRLEKPLYDSQLNLTGKPDYLVERDGVWIPVEVKSRSAPEILNDGHVLQLAAYCRLVEHTSGKRPPYGILNYRNRTFQVDYTPELENRLKEILVAMHKAERGECNRSHEEPARCTRCGYRDTCDQRLAV